MNVKIIKVNNNNCAEKAGLKEDDEVVKINEWDNEITRRSGMFN